MSEVENAGITLSASAARRIAKILQAEPPGSMLRVAVNGGGCSGFQYEFSIARAANPDDFRIVKDGVTALVDEISAQYMSGAEIDFSEELIGAAFKIRNPQAAASCGCGTSFSV